MTNTTQIQVGKSYKVPSGLGGVFYVRALAVRGDEVDCRVDMPSNPDWHNYVVVCKAAEMQVAS